MASDTSKRAKTANGDTNAVVDVDISVEEDEEATRKKANISSFFFMLIVYYSSRRISKERDGYDSTGKTWGRQKQRRGPEVGSTLKSN